MRWHIRALDHLIANVALWLAVAGLLFIGPGALIIGRRRTMPPQPNEFEQERRKHEHHIPPPPVPPEGLFPRAPTAFLYSVLGLLNLEPLERAPADVG